MSTTATRAARWIGGLMLAQMVVGPVVNFTLMDPVLAAPGFLVNAAAHPLHASLAAVLGLALGGLAVGIAITVWPVFRRHGEAMALWFLALSVAGLATASLESATVLSMLSLSQAYVSADAAEPAALEAAGVVVRSARRWAHYLHLIVGGGGALVFYASLLRFALVPRPLAAFGVAATLLQLVAVTLPLFGHPMVFLLLLPRGLSHLAVALWLLVRGFAERPPIRRA